MDPLSPKSIVSDRRGWSGTAALCLWGAVCMLAMGCVTTGSFLHLGDDKPTGDICLVVATWGPEVVYTPDPAHAGTPSPGIAGRVYLFGSDITYPLVGDGGMVVDLYQVQGPGGANNTKLLEEWRIDKETLKRLLRRDAIGWGYTLFLPWGSYKPEITHVQMRIRYEPVKGSPIYGDVVSVALGKNTNAASKATVTAQKPKS